MARPCRRGQAGVTSGLLALFPGAVNVSYITSRVNMPPRIPVCPHLPVFAKMHSSDALLYS